MGHLHLHVKKKKFCFLTDIYIAVSTAIEELSVDLPEELASGGSPFSYVHVLSSNPWFPESDLPSPEDWEDNSMMASDSEVGLPGSP